MKNLNVFITAILLIMIIKPVHAQNFISEDKVWSFISQDNSGPFWEGSFHYRFMGDTIINDLKYYALYESNDQNSWRIDSYWYERNDSIYIKEKSNDKETLIYNFNLQEGDSMHIDFFAETEEPLVYMYVDSVRVWNWGQKLRKFIYFRVPYNNQWFPTIWIEGIGQFKSLTLSTSVGLKGHNTYLICFEENGETVYHDSNYENCYVYPTSIDLLAEKPQLIEVISVENKTLYINSNENYGEIIFYSLEGKQLLKQKISEPETQICLPYQGIIIYQFNSNKGEVQTGKVMVR